MQGSQTLGKTKKSKTAQRHSAGNIDYDNLPGSQESDDIPSQTQHTFRSRSKTVGDGKFFFLFYWQNDGGKRECETTFSTNNLRPNLLKKVILIFINFCRATTTPEETLSE